MKNKNIILAIISVIFLTSPACAVYTYHHYFDDSFVPQQQNLEVKDTILVDSFTGAAVYNYPLDLPPGTHGLQPSVSITYNSQGMIRRPDVLGMGWSLSQNYIQRDINHTVNNLFDDEFILVFGGNSYDLIYDSNDGRYHTKVESYLNIQNMTGANNEKGNYWVLKTKEGTSYRFGFYNSSELVSNQDGTAWRWSLDLVKDSYGNSIFYNYTENPFPRDEGMVYIDSIEYNNDRQRKISFYYQSSDMLHLRTVYEYGNKITQSRILDQIVINVNGSTLRRYFFDYRILEYNGNLQSISNITEYGTNNVSFLSPVQFEYNAIGDSLPSTNWTFANCTGSISDGCFVLAGLGEDTGARLADLNGDGLVDVIRATTSSGVQTFAWFNNGSGFYRTNWTFANCTGANSDGCFVTSGLDTGSRLVDLNADGLVDVIRATTSSGVQTWSWSNNGWANYLLKKINFSLGGEISLNYQKSTSLNNKGNDSRSDLNFNIWVVFNITKKNNVEGPHNTSSLTVYNLSGGSYDYARQEFRGFNIAEEKTSNVITRHWFHQDDSRNGKEYKTQIEDNQSNLFSTVEKQWSSTQQNGYYLVNMDQESKLDYDGLVTPRVSNTTYNYDGFGNVAYKRSLGDVNNTSDDRFEFYNYVNNTSSWIMDKLANYSLMSADNVTLLRNTLYRYDDLGFGTSPTKGGLTRKEEWLSSGSNALTLYGYDSFGNLINSTDPNGRVTKYSYGSREITNTFPDNMTNAKNHTTSYFYDLGTGNLLAEQDSNGFVKNYTFDTFSIQKSIILPFDSATLPTQNYSYEFNPGFVGKITVKQREQSGQTGTLDTNTFYDGFGRIIQKKTEASNSQQIVIDTYYDELGRIKEQSNPYFITPSENYSTPNVTIARVAFTYDVLNRLIKITNPDSTFKNLSYSHWNVTTYDENGNKKAYLLNAYDKIIKVIEYNGAEIYYTQYNYSSADELIGIIDALNNTINYTYDTLGRKTRMMDPDMGTWNYQYDSAGNLIKQTDNLGQNLTFSYDDLNRKISENATGRNITYVYDLLTNNTLSMVFASNFSINYTYDSRLRKISERKTIDGITTTQNWTYDASDRILSHTLPSGEVINFTYNEQGLLLSIVNIVNATYNEKNNLLLISYNNTLSTSYNYLTDTFRLKRITTANKQDLNYSYDGVGNVKGINDTIHNRNISMNYDSLNRLTYTQITDSQTTTLNFIYNAIGNMLNMTGTQNAEFYYNSGKAHAPSKVIYY